MKLKYEVAVKARSYGRWTNEVLQWYTRDLKRLRISVQ